MAVDHELIALASHVDAQADSVRSKMLHALHTRLRRIAEYRTVVAYRKLFLDANGDLKPEAVAVIADFATVARLGVADTIRVSDAELRERSGRRALALHLLGRLDLDGSRLRKLAKTMREPDSE